AKKQASGFAFLRHGGIYRSDVVSQNHLNLGPGAASRWSAPEPSNERYGRNYAPCSVASSAMSSGRLFLDRVARQHCPSPLHRHGHHILWTNWPKGIIIESQAVG